MVRVSSSTVPACMPPFTRGQSAVIRWISGCGHFRSRNKDGGQTIRSAVAEYLLLYANCTALSFKQLDLLPIEFLHCGKRELRLFLRKTSGKYWNFPFVPHKWCRRCRNTFSGPLLTVPSCMLPELHAVKVGVVTSGHVTKMAVKPFDLPLLKTPCYTQTAWLYLLSNQSYCQLKFYAAGIGNFAYLCEK